MLAIATDDHLLYSSKLNQLESQYASLQQEHADLQETTDILRAKLVTVSEELVR